MANRNPSALDFARIHTLGQAEAVPVRMHDDVLYELTQYKFPMTSDEFDSAFPSEMKLFGAEQPAKCPGKQLSPLVLDAGNNELDDFFWLTGISLVAFGEGKSFTINGGLIDRPAGDVEVPCFDGCPSEEGAGPAQASLYWGGPTWQFLSNFLYAYRFKWLIRRYEYLNVSAGALGITHMGPEFIGAGCSQVPAMPYIQQVNQAMEDKGINKIFIPQNSAGDPPECIGAPTADVVYGSPKLNGSQGRPYCLTRPMLLAPGMHLKMSFERVEGDCCYYDAMRKNAVFDSTVSGLPDNQTTHGECQDQAYTLPGGCLTLGVVLQGQVMDEEACWEALTRNVAYGVGTPMHEMLKGNAAITNLIQRRTKGSLAGVPENVRGLLEPSVG